MHRIDTKTAQKDKFGAGKNGFTRGNPQTGTPATDLDDDYFDMLQEELCSVVEASGASLEKGRNDQLLTALRALLLSRKNPFGDIKSDGTVKTALENLQLRESFSGVVGEARNAQMNIIRSSAFASFSADEIIVESSIGQQYRLRAFNKTIDLRMSGTGGMDVGKAPSEGFIALYAILNPTSGETALLAVNATTIIAPEIYAGNHMPDGYTASALVSVWKTDLARNFVAGFQNGRHVVMNSTNVLTTALPAESYTELSIANAVPLNAKTIDGYINVNPVIASINSYCSIASDLSGIGVKSFGTSSSGILANFSDLHLITPQKIYYTIGVAGDMKDSFVNLTGYKI